MSRFGFGPARPGEPTAFGAQRPGYPATSVDQETVDEWVTFMKQKGVQRVYCLLDQKQLAYYKKDLLGVYRGAFGGKHVYHTNVEDYRLCDLGDLEDKILPCLQESDQNRTPVVVHCSGGSGRTGHILAAWLVRERGLSVDEAIEAVCNTGRNPWEAVQLGNATEEQLRALLAGSAD